MTQVKVLCHLIYIYIYMNYLLRPPPLQVASLEYSNCLFVSPTYAGPTGHCTTSMRTSAIPQGDFWYPDTAQSGNRESGADKTPIGPQSAHIGPNSPKSPQCELMGLRGVPNRGLLSTQQHIHHLKSFEPRCGLSQRRVSGTQKQVPYSGVGALCRYI